MESAPVSYPYQEYYPYEDSLSYPGQDEGKKKKKKDHSIMIVFLILLIVFIIAAVIGFVIFWLRWMSYP